MKKMLLILLLILFTSCDLSNDPQQMRVGPQLTIRHGVSFGFCIGYCKREVTIAGESLKFEKSSWHEPEYPDLNYSGLISEGTWIKLVNLLDKTVIMGMDSVYGCPDCADGGAEWIEITDRNFSKKIVFEYGASLRKIQPLLNELRIIRREYEAQYPN